MLNEEVNRFSRRSFLNVGVAALSVAASDFSITSTQADSRLSNSYTPMNRPIRGVSLGAWFVLEKWIVPSMFEGSTAADEFTLCQELGPKAASKKMNQHWDNWITDKDFEWLSAHGINLVRLPIGYWAVKPDGPYVDASYALDRALKMAAKHKIAVLVDLHGAPGSQNGWDHSGHAGALNWPEPDNVAKTVEIIDLLAARCTQHPNVVGIELLNEPRWDVPLDILKNYYQRAYLKVRNHLSADRAAVVIHDSFRQDVWHSFMEPPQFENVILDTHLYQCFDASFTNMSLNQHLEYSLNELPSQLQKMSGKKPIVVGEWSLALPGSAWNGVEQDANRVGHRAYADLQMLSYSQIPSGWIFWTLKTENSKEWSLMDCVENGWMPQRYNLA